VFAEHLTSVASSPQRQISAILASRDFLLRLTRPQETPKVPPAVRREALALLRHFPPTERLRPVLERQMGAGDAKPIPAPASELGVHWPAGALRGPIGSKQNDINDQNQASD
jgi:hypothetical protein